MHVLDMFKLDGKVALITGGYGRYGSQMTEALAEAGATVITASRSLEKNEAYAAQLRERGLKVYAESYDMADEDSILQMRDRLIERFGKVDILVNNSAMRGCFTGGFDGDAKGFTKSLEANGTGLYVITRAFGNLMAERGEGSIINIGSYMGHLGPNDPLYEGTDMSAWGGADYFFYKSGMHNLTRFFAAYYGRFNVRCNCLALGGQYNRYEPQPEAFRNNYSKSTYLGRLANEEDVKGIIVYLASNASLYTTGTVIPVDGGYSAK